MRVDTQRLDDMMNMVGELVLVRNRLTKLQVAAHRRAPDQGGRRPEHGRHRSADRGDEDPYAADQEGVRQVPARGTRPGAQPQQGNQSRSAAARTPRSTRTWSRCSTTRWCTWCATPATTASRRRRRAPPPASRAPARCCWPPNRPAITSC
ncbi:MAG: hypothetical protein MZV65_54605 [Chromatiales bacterium]|nr:hypothetical protein [Chromatiales bacterium]